MYIEVIVTCPACDDDFDVQVFEEKETTEVDCPYCDSVMKISYVVEARLISNVLKVKREVEE